MQVKDIMTREPATCSPATNLAEAAAMMLEADCGMLPVLDAGKIVGVVTDRDMYVALATRGKRAFEITAQEVVQSPVQTCGPEDDVHSVLEAMKEHRVRRLPVAGFEGSILGVVSMNDIVLAAGRRKGVREADVLAAMQAICAHHRPAPHVVAA